MDVGTHAGAPAPTVASGHRRLARTLSGSRWGEYRRILEHALDRGYRVVALEDWLRDPQPTELPTLILRHDVDQDPRTVGPMLDAEQELGLSSTWYFRWRTADPRAIDWVRQAGGGVGLHYETLTRRILSGGGEPDSLIEDCRRELRDEIAAFEQLFGTIRSVCPHGDSRVPGVTNQVLLRDVDVSSYGIEFDGNDAVGRRRLAVWLTDRSAPDGRWKDGMNPFELLDDGETPVLCLTHPNNFASGADLWADRLAATVLPTPPPGRAPLIMRTGSDAPPAVSLLGRSAFAHIADDLQRFVHEYYAARDEPLTRRARLNTLLTNSRFAERRLDTLLNVLYARSDLRTVAGLRVLDMGCGFGALALALAFKGATVTGVDPNVERFRVGCEVAARHGLRVAFLPGWMEETDVGAGHFDLIVLNNSFCYLTAREARRAALGRMWDALRPGGWLVMRNPNRLFPVDQFTGLPLIGLLPPAGAAALARAARRDRSRVRLTTVIEARRELRRARFVDVATGSPHPSGLRRRLTALARYQHLVARRPSESDA